MQEVQVVSFRSQFQSPVVFAEKTQVPLVPAILTMEAFETGDNFSSAISRAIIQHHHTIWRPTLPRQ
jgi:hypothetical protein